MDRQLFFASATTYNTYESHKNTPHHRKCIDGKITGSGKCVGYCEFRDHPGYLTKELRRKHNCIKKGCNYYVPKEKQDVPANVFAVLFEIV